MLVGLVGLVNLVGLDVFFDTVGVKRRVNKFVKHVHICVYTYL